MRSRRKVIKLRKSSKIAPRKFVFLECRLLECGGEEEIDGNVIPEGFKLMLGLFEIAPLG